MTLIEQEPGEPAWTEPDEKMWRSLAMQFDAHRMQTLGHLKCLLTNHQAHQPVVEAFLQNIPLEADSILLDIVRNMAMYHVIATVDRVTEDDALEDDEDDGRAVWRRLAFQFDQHRVMALAQLQSLLINPDTCQSEVATFLNAGPENGVAVMRARILQAKHTLAS